LPDFFWYKSRTLLPVRKRAGHSLQWYSFGQSPLRSAPLFRFSSVVQLISSLLSHAQDAASPFLSFSAWFCFSVDLLIAVRQKKEKKRSIFLFHCGQTLCTRRSFWERHGQQVFLFLTHYPLLFIYQFLFLTHYPLLFIYQFLFRPCPTFSLFTNYF
jgi:hypothetical protein